MANVLNGVKNVGKKLENGAVKVVRVGSALIAGAVGFELGVLGASMLVNDARTVKEVVSPTPVRVKEKGLLGKKRVVSYNPVTKKVSDYKGKKSPVNKKPVKIDKKRITNNKGGVR